MLGRCGSGIQYRKTYCSRTGTLDVLTNRTMTKQADATTADQIDDAYCATVTEQNIDGATLSLLAQDELTELGVVSAVHRAKLYVRWHARVRADAAVAAVTKAQSDDISTAATSFGSGALDVATTARVSAATAAQARLLDNHAVIGCGGVSPDHRRRVLNPLAGLVDDVAVRHKEEE